MQKLLGKLSKKELEQWLDKIGLKPGSLLKTKSEARVFWLDGSLPGTLQPFLDDNDNVVQEYISGRNGWKKVQTNEILLFLGIGGLLVEIGESSITSSTKECLVLKWLCNNQVLFWTLDGLGSLDRLLEEFEFVSE